MLQINVQGIFSGKQVLFWTCFFSASLKRLISVTSTNEGQNWRYRYNDLAYIYVLFIFDQSLNPQHSQQPLRLLSFSLFFIFEQNFIYIYIYKKTRISCYANCNQVNHKQHLLLIYRFYFYLGTCVYVMFFDVCFFQTWNMYCFYIQAVICEWASLNLITWYMPAMVSGIIASYSTNCRPLTSYA